MKRSILAALLAALAVAAPAGAAPLLGSRTAIDAEQPIRAYAAVTPPVQLFGDTVTASVTVLADTKWIDPAGMRLTADFNPYTPTGPPTVTRTEAGRILREKWTWSLRCLTAPCVPVVPPSDVFHDFRFRAARIEYVLRGGTAQSLHARFPTLEALSEVSPGLVASVEVNKTIDWQYQLAPSAARPYRVSPELVFWAAIAVAALLGAAGLALAGRWALRLRTAPSAAVPALPASYLERALALFFWARAHGDETLQRKALERVADELPLDVIHLSDAARELAWSPEAPEGDEVEAISQRAGVPAHHENGTGE